MKICILGSNGFIGRHLATYFPYATALNRMALDLLDADKVKEYFAANTFDVVIHCAIVGGSRLRPDGLDVLDGNLRMFFNVRAATSARLIYLSSGAALRGEPPSDPYGFSKYVIEHMPNIQIIRIWGCFGPDEAPTRFIASARKNGHVTIHGDRKFDFFHVDDLCKVVEYALTWNGPALNAVYSGPKRQLSEIADLMGVPYTVLDEPTQDYTGEFNIHGVDLPSLESRLPGAYMRSPRADVTYS